MKSEVSSADAPKAIGPYSAGIDAGAFVFCSGQIGVDPRTNEIADGIVRQTSMALENLGSVLRAKGLGLNDIVKTTVFMVDLAEFKQMNEEYAKHFSAPFPARSTVQVAALPRGARIEIEAVAAIRQ